jgi:coenzyme F420-0:L-glutamate ligase/coenzyme F420-1:gamma-L-glutamate ligase
VPVPTIACDARLTVDALPGIPLVRPGDDVAALLAAALERARLALAPGDVVVVASKLISRAEDRFVDLAGVTPGARALALAAETDADPRIVELVLRDTAEISRAAPGALVVRHRLGFVVANGGLDLSNAVPPGAAAGSGPWALLLPEDPDASAERLRNGLAERTGANGFGVVVSDSFGRPFRIGSVGAAIGIAGLPAVWDMRGRTDLCGRALEHTLTALADQLAAAADLVAGQSDEGRPALLVRGLRFAAAQGSARELCRPPGQDLYARRGGR